VISTPCCCSAGPVDLTMAMVSADRVRVIAYPFDAFQTHL
jgi:hypothetical protein